MMKKHLHNSLRALFLSLAVLLSLPMLAVEVEIDDINYDLNAEAEQATVIAKTSDKYSGEVVIPESVEHEGTAYSVTSIGEDAFCYCSALTSVTIPNSVTSIGDGAFNACTGLTSVTIPNTVISIGEETFNFCYRLTSVTIGNSVTSIGDRAFRSCSGLTSVTIPNSVTSIGNYAFDGCSGLESVIIPNSVTSIGQNPFANCSSLNSIVVEENNSFFDSRDNCNAIVQTGDNILLSGCVNTTIPNNIANIGGGAFSGCSGLTSVTIPNSVTSIGYGAFFGCSGLTSVTIPNSVTSIGDEAFHHCSGLTSVTIPNSVTSIGGSTFSRCSSLTSVTIPNSVTSIGGLAFEGCYGLKHIIIGDSVTSIGHQAFNDCSNLTSVAVGKSVTNIGDHAFGNCFKLKTIYNLSALNFTQGSLDYGWIARYAVYVINIPNGSLEGNFIFSVTDGKNVLCRYLGNETEPILPENCKGETYVIGSDVFKNNATIVSLIIPNSVTSIEDEAFYGCFGLTSVTIPNSVKSIGDGAFFANTRLTSVHITDLAAWCNIEFGSSTANPLGWAQHLYINGEDVKDLAIPDSVTSIGKYAFYRFSALTSVTIPNSVATIEASAFYNCYSLASVTIGNGLTAIGNESFYECQKLKTVYNFSNLSFIRGRKDHGYVAYYANNVINVPNGFFDGDYIFSVIDGKNALCGYIGNETELTLPENYRGSAYEIGSNAFNGNNALTSVIIGDSVTGIGNAAFANCSGLTSVTIPNSVTSIGNYAFRSCSGLTSVTIPNSVTSIGEGTFSGCSGLTSVSIPNSVTSIGSSAFWGCSGLTSVIIPNSVTSIGEETFLGCSGLTSVTIGNSVTDIGNAAFAYCSGLNSITIPNSVASIGSSAFSNCSALTSVTIPNSVTSIGEHAFLGCSGLTSITIPNSVTSIEGSTFRGCSGLTSVTIGNSVTSIGEEAFSFCGLASVSIPDSVISVGQKAFYACSTLTSVTIGNGVRDIYSNAFANCSELLDVYCYAEVAPSAKRDAFIGSYPEYSTLYVPHTSIEDYKKEAPWSTFGTIKAIPGTERYTITFMLEGTEFHKDTLVAGSSITLPEAPEKEGHSFNGWKDVPETMPANDVVVVGSYSVNKYLLTFKIGDEVIASDSIEYGAKVETPQVAEKEGHTFNGWENVPETMPANDVVVVGSYSVNKYLLTFKIGDEVLSADSIEYGANVETPQVAEKEGHTFNGWENVPETMPANDVVVVGSYSVNKYLLTFKIGDEVLSVGSVEYGAKIETPVAPEKEGHTFCGWKDVPETMPANDVVIVGSYSVNKYLLTFKIGDEVLSADSIEYGAKVETPQVAEKEGHTFNGWKNVPETMPANDVVVVGSYSVNKYLLTFKIGDEVIASDSIEYGAKVETPQVAEKEGHTFNGWENVPETMPANDIVVVGSYTVNIYKVYYYVGDELVHTDEVAYGESIPAYEYTPTNGDKFMGWDGEQYDTMPAHDVTYIANIESGILYINGDMSEYQIYDLNGRKIENAKSLKSGVYIVNGKKTIVKAN